jgi:hypothetical protein
MLMQSTLPVGTAFLVEIQNVEQKMQKFNF